MFLISFVLTVDQRHSDRIRFLMHYHVVSQFLQRAYQVNGAQILKLHSIQGINQIFVNLCPPRFCIRSGIVTLIFDRSTASQTSWREYF